jgi:hypothetical protein
VARNRLLRGLALPVNSLPASRAAEVAPNLTVLSYLFSGLQRYEFRISEFGPLPPETDSNPRRPAWENAFRLKIKNMASKAMNTGQVDSATSQIPRTERLLNGVNLE